MAIRNLTQCHSFVDQGFVAVTHGHSWSLAVTRLCIMSQKSAMVTVTMCDHCDHGSWSLMVTHALRRVYFGFRNLFSNSNSSLISGSESCRVSSLQIVGGRSGVYALDGASANTQLGVHQHWQSRWPAMSGM